MAFSVSQKLTAMSCAAGGNVVSYLEVSDLGRVRVCSCDFVDRSFAAAECLTLSAGSAKTHSQALSEYFHAPVDLHLTSNPASQLIKHLFIKITPAPVFTGLK
jgi:hypothetical protein